MAKASSKPLLICGGFNAPHTHWGYGSDSPKGRRLAELVDDLGLTLLNEPASHTRIGQGVCRDTTPDLSIILSLVVGRIVEEQASNRKVRIVECDKFRKTRDREKKEGPIEDIGAWCKEILAYVEKATKEIEWTDWQEKEAQGDGSSDRDVQVAAQIHGRSGGPCGRSRADAPHSTREPRSPRVYRRT
ncbi:hypothetical protein MTO96_036737 [Rhipicephalus appendiculatus]